ncbi:hypothetical protein [Paenibacillus tengchongensis]|uniref:hypothetical protein n=1 Tax=Paenibacillus tengchongensis TaxID=2608684 RepID=UPI00124F2A35|nr:hypothetical protein [Paenibacillus tengchongensis]
MKKKIMLGILTVAACFTLGSTSFAAPSPTVSSVEQNAVVTPAATKYITYQTILPKSLFPTLNDIPTINSYYVDGYSGQLTLISIDAITAYTWTVTYGGWVTN